MRVPTHCHSQARPGPAMDVTKENFESVLPEIEGILADRDLVYVAIDFEMTGIVMGDPKFRSGYGDDMQVRPGK
jgi:hypothetical protein